MREDRGGELVTVRSSSHLMVADSLPVASLTDGHRPPGVVSDRLFRFVAMLAGFSVLVILGLIAVSTTREAWPAFSQEGLSFFTSSTWDVPAREFGALAFIYGTLLVSGIALFVSVPVSIGIALFVTEIAPTKMRRPIVNVIDLLAAVPSVVYGLWGLLVLAPPLNDFYTNLSSAVNGVPVLGTLFSGEPISGVSYMTAGIIVALMITPIITSITREVFATVPTAQKEAASALGATRWEMIRGSVFPHSRSGLVGAVLIGLGRAMGETIAVALLVGSATSITAKLFSPGDTMAAVIANQFGEATDVYRSALMALGVVLFAITIIIGVIARGFVARVDAPERGLMTAVSPSIPVTRLGPAAKHRSRAIRNGLATALIVLSFIVVLIPLALLIGYVVVRGRAVFGWAFLTKEIPTPRNPGAGMGPAVYGTLLITGAATLMAVPLGILGGVYLSEYGKRGVIARVLRFFAEVMTGVPSIIMGLFVYTAVVLRTQELNAFAGALALGCLMLPIVIRTTDEMLRLVPDDLREGSTALGSRQARTIVRIVLPAAAPGIVSGALLAVARAAGETAPLLFVIGTTFRTNTSLFEGSNTTLSVQIFKNASSPFVASQDRAWAAALTLILIVFVFTVLARLVTAFYSRRSSAA